MVINRRQNLPKWEYNKSNRKVYKMEKCEKGKFKVDELKEVLYKKVLVFVFEQRFCVRVYIMAGINIPRVTLFLWGVLVLNIQHR